MLEAKSTAEVTARSMAAMSDPLAHTLRIVIPSKSRFLAQASKVANDQE